MVHYIIVFMKQYSVTGFSRYLLEMLEVVEIIKNFFFKEVNSIIFEQKLIHGQCIFMEFLSQEGNFTLSKCTVW